MLYKKLWKDTYFLFFGIYWLVGALGNTITIIPGIDSRANEIITVIYNMIDIPLILWIIGYTSSFMIAGLLRPIILIYIFVELILVISLGINYEAIKYTIGVGVLVVLSTLAWQITLYLQRVEYTNREKSMLFIHAALLFEYGSYIIVYIFDYFIIPADNVDKLLIYYISTLIAITIASFGFINRKTKDAVIL